MFSTWPLIHRRSRYSVAKVKSGAAPDFTFATLYRLRRWHGGELQNVYEGGRYLSCADNPEGLFV